MRAAPVLKAASGCVTRRLLQTSVIVVVLAGATAAATLGLSLLTNANEAFLNGFAIHHGADIALTVDTSRVRGAQLAATRHVPGVFQVAGPYPELTITIQRYGSPGQPGEGPKGGPGAGGADSQMTVTARASQGGPLDDITVQSGHWLTGPGQIVLAPYFGSSGPVGSTLTVVSAPGKPKLTIAGYGGSPGRFGAAWVTPGELAALRPRHAPAMAQMLYTFGKASNAPQIAADVSALKAALPAGTVTGYDSWLDSENQTNGEQSVNTPFVLAFALIGLVLAALIVASLVSGGVVAGYRRIGVLKSIGFTPLQVAAAYLTQIGAPTLGGAVAGVVLGNLWAAPTLNMAAGLFKVGAQHVPVRIDLVVPAGMCALVALAALIPALRAGRLSTVGAITAGQAPRTARGYAAHRLAGRLALPRPVTAGLAAAFTRPARSATIVATIVFGATAVILAVGLNSSLVTMQQLGNHGQPDLLVAQRKGSAQPTLTRSQSQTVTAAIRAQSGTLRYVAVADDGDVINSVSVPGLPGMNLVAYDGDTTWLGWPLISGHWYRAPGEVDVNTEFLTQTGLKVGDRFTLTMLGRPVTARVAGQIYAPNGPSLYTSWQTLGGAAVGLKATSYAIELRPGASSKAYQAALRRILGSRFGVLVPQGAAGPSGPANPSSLIGLLTELIAVLAGLGVFMSVLMLTRERVYDLGIFKAIGMTPRQLITMVICWVIAPAIAAAAIAIPAAVYLHSVTVQGIGAVTDTGTPASAIAVYHPAQLLLLALFGLVIAAVGALGPAIWAAASKAAAALHTE